MINRTAIAQWNKVVPWNDNAQIEQDLIISRALVAILEMNSLPRSWLSGEARHSTPQVVSKSSA